MNINIEYDIKFKIEYIYKYIYKYIQFNIHIKKKEVQAMRTEHLSQST